MNKRDLKKDDASEASYEIRNEQKKWIDPLSKDEKLLMVSSTGKESLIDIINKLEARLNCCIISRHTKKIF